MDERLRNDCWTHPSHRAFLIGEAPGPNTRSDYPLYPYPPRSAAGRLAVCIGFSRREYLLSFSRINLLDTYPGPVFPIKSGKLRVPEVTSWLDGRPVLLLGRSVARCFGLHSVDPLEMSELWPGQPAAMVPHPSGRNLWYNDPHHRANLREFFQQFKEKDPINEA